HVYDVTPYLQFHPGGEDQIMQVAGLDASEMFEKIHPWVNYKSLIESCYVGKLTKTSTVSLLAGGLKCTTLQSQQNPNIECSSSGQSNPSTLTKGHAVSVPPSMYIDRQAPNEHSITLTVCNKKAERINACDLVVYINPPQNIVFVLYEVNQECTTYSYSLRSIACKDNLEVSELKENEDGNWAVEFVCPETEILGITKVSKFLFKPMLVSKQGLLWPITLKSRDQITPSTHLYTFRVPSNLYICPRIGSYTLVKLDDSDSQECRAYTPIASIAFRPRPKRFVAELNFIIKTVPNGFMSSYMSRMHIGGSLLISPCIDQCRADKLTENKPILLLAAGSGITPFVDLISFAIKRKSEVKLIYCNQSEAETIYRQEIDRLAANERLFNVVHVISNPSPDWTGEQGPITLKFIKAQVSSKEKMFIGVCGSPEFIITVSSLLDEASIDMSDYHKFG
ncbi:hypothetical protein GJ496_011387, partial [Pomphorhynchus laevis]